MQEAFSPPRQYDRATIPDGLFIDEVVFTKPGQKVLIDDLSGGAFSIRAELEAAGKALPLLKNIELHKLNVRLLQQVEQLLYELYIDPQDVLFVVTGGGGGREIDSLEEIGCYMPNVLSIKVERPTIDGNQKGEAVVIEESIEALRQALAEGGMHVVVVDDAVNTGGTLKVVQKVIDEILPDRETNNQLLIAAAPIQFATTKGVETTKLECVSGYDYTLISQGIISHNDKNPDVTFVSSIGKKTEKLVDDPRLNRMNRDWKVPLDHLVVLFGPIRKLYIESYGKIEPYEPNDQRMIEMIRIFSHVQDPQDIANFYRDVLTDREIARISKRFEVAMQLCAGVDKRAVAENVHLSPTTVTRIDKWVRKGCGGYGQAYQTYSGLDNISLQDTWPIGRFDTDYIPTERGFRQLALVMAAQKDISQIGNLIRDVFTEVEIGEISKRFGTAMQLLSNGITLDQVSADQSLTLDTVNRVFDWINNQGAKGYECFHRYWAQLQQTEANEN